MAPAGNTETAKIAIYSGADAVYLGLKSFSARDAAENFDRDSLKEIIAFAHFFSRKVYVALNTVVKESELDEFFRAAEEALSLGADALILQDMYLGSLIKKSFPEARLHLSTQAGVCNAMGAEAAKELGFSRVIAARETPVKDLAEISKIIECEAFVQGALCTCYSGQCYFSSFVGGNSGNRGRCKQPCRKLYSWDREDYDTPAYRLSLCDLRVGEYTPRLIAAGVTSLKIEGRLRRPEYVAAAVRYYRDILDGIPTEDDERALRRTYNRGGYTKGLAFGQSGKLISSVVQGHIGECAGTVEIIAGRPVCRTRDSFGKGDAFKILRDGKEVGGAVFGEKTNAGFSLKSSANLKRGDQVFVTTDASLNRELAETTAEKPVRISIRLMPGEKPRAEIDGVVIYGDDVLEEAKERPVTRAEVMYSFTRDTGHPFFVAFMEHGDVELGNVFIPVSRLNAFRRKVFDGYWEKSTARDDIEVKINAEYVPLSGRNGKVAVIAEDLSGLKADIGILKPKNFAEIDEKLWREFSGEKYLFLPPYLTGYEIDQIAPLISPFDGIYADGVYGVGLAKKLGKCLFAGTGFNVTNSADVALCGAKYIALSKELTAKEAEEISAENTFYLTAGAIKLMDLVYCPFDRRCDTCDKKEWYTLTDEAGRKFPVRRYGTPACRFELFNCDDLVCENNFTGRLFDCTKGKASETLAAFDAENLKEIYRKHTGGHSVRPVL